MNVASLLDRYALSSKTKELLFQINNHEQSLFANELKGSSVSFVLSALYRNINKNIFVLCAAKELAAHLYNDSQKLTGEEASLFFPSSGRKPYEIDRIENSNILMRAEVLEKTAQENKTYLIFSYPEAVSEKVVTRSLLKKNTLSLTVGESISIDFINDLLYELNFEKTDYITHPGQYSIRGGIIDIFSFADELPYRIELSGDSVNSIRKFDPSTQLSTIHCHKATIIPNIQTKLLKENRQHFLEYISENNLLVLIDDEMIYAASEKFFEQAQKSFEKLESTIEQLKPEELFCNKQQLENEISRHQTLYINKKKNISNNAKQIQFNCSIQPTFNKNFELLISNLEENLLKGINNLIFFDSEKQRERLTAIVSDIRKENGRELFSSITHPLHEGFIDKDLGIACYSDHQIFERYQRYHLKEGFNNQHETITLKEIKSLKPGDYVTHIDHGIGRFGGLEKIEVNGKLQEAIRLVYKDNDVLYVSIHSLHRIAKYSGQEGSIPKLNKLGSNAWQNLKQKTKKKVKEIAFDLIKLYAKRKSQKGFAYSPDNYLQHEMEASFIYEDTPDQLKATNDVKKDMEQQSPMDRLICGDVGFGKTEIAIRAAFKAVNDNKQVAVLVPTTLLAVQHHKTFSERLKGFPCNIDFLCRFKSPKEQKETIQKLKEGKTDIVIGTHGLVGKEVTFKDLGLLIVDEEQKFGVGVKDKIKTLKESIDTLTLTATPIPRTLQFSLMGARDLSIISTPPPNRYPVQTEVHTFDENLIRDAIMYEVNRGGQVFIVHNRVQNIVELKNLVQKLCPDIKITIGHGQMENEVLEKSIYDFIEGEFDVLISTAIIESGLDISNANTIIINDAHNFGLSDLHQLRGRVGRSNKKAFCHILVPSFLTLTSDAQKRLKALEDFSDLGSGFNIAMRDLDIRGAGNLLGAEQSGFINEIGYEMYQKILNEAMHELREEQDDKNMIADHIKAPVGYVSDCQIDTDLELLIPENYVSNVGERINLYRTLDNSQNDNDLNEFISNLTDRFGEVPPQTTELIKAVRLRKISMEKGFEKLILKNKRMVAYFVSSQHTDYFQSEMFGAILQFVQKNPGLCKMKQNNDKLSLTFDHVTSINDALEIMLSISKNAKILT